MSQKAALIRRLARQERDLATVQWFEGIEHGQTLRGAYEFVSGK